MRERTNIRFIFYEDRYIAFLGRIPFYAHERHQVSSSVFDSIVTSSFLFLIEIDFFFSSARHFEDQWDIKIKTKTTRIDEREKKKHWKWEWNTCKNQSRLLRQ